MVPQLPKLAWLLNPAPGIRSRLDCCVQHLPFVQDWPFPVLHDVAQLPQWELSVLVFVQTEPQTVALQTQLLLTQLGVDPPHEPHI